MKTIAPLLCLALAACGSQTAGNSANATAETRPAAATAEAISDTQAAEADALKAADAELDNLSNSIDDPAPANRAGVSNTTKVEVY
ncbi:MAG TPA: hypothetical protein VEZ48_06970 [Sphingomonadaceae bacterium]|jgi:hypothetical protein|nr:hypothetical protein [Sphingomonadaceae bacterium]